MKMKIYVMMLASAAVAVLLTACSDIRFREGRSGGSAARSDAGNRSPLVIKGGMPAPFEPDQVIPDSIRYQTFAFVRETLRSGYFDSTFSGVNWDSLCHAYEPQVALKTESGAFHRLLDDMINRLGASHLRITPPHIQQAGRVSRRPFSVDGLEIRRIGDSYMVTAVSPLSKAYQSGISTGDIIITVDSAVVKGRADERLLLGDSASVCRLTYLDRDDHTCTVALPRLSRVYTTMERLTRARVVCRKLDDEIGYLKIDIWGINLNDQLKQAFSIVNDTRGMIIDVRHNPGGAGSDCLMKYLCEDSTLTGYQVFRDGGTVPLMSEGSGGKAYAGTIAVLTDSRSGSTSELFAANLQEWKRAIVIGEPSYGGVLNATQTLLPSGGTMLYPNAAMYTAEHTLLEGSGVTPDYKVRMKRDDLYNGIDTVIEAAKRILKNALG